MPFNKFSNANPQAQKTDPGATTNGPTFYNGDDCLTVKYYDKTINLSICHAETVDGKRRFNRQGGTSIVITHDRTSVLSSLLFDEFLPAVTSGKAYSAAILTNSDCNRMLGFNTNGGVACITIYADIDDNRIAHTIAQYTFATYNVVDRYDPQNGSYTFRNTPIQNQLIDFCRSIESFDYAMCNAEAHAAKYENRFVTRHRISDTNKIMNKLGIEVSYQKTGSSYANNSAQPNITATDITNLDNLFDSEDSPF